MSCDERAVVAGSMTPGCHTAMSGSAPPEGRTYRTFYLALPPATGLGFSGEQSRHRGLPSPSPAFSAAWQCARLDKDAHSAIAAQPVANTRTETAHATEKHPDETNRHH